MRKQKPLITLAVSLIAILCATGIILAFAGGPACWCNRIGHFQSGELRTGKLSHRNRQLGFRKSRLDRSSDQLQSGSSLHVYRYAASNRPASLGLSVFCTDPSERAIGRNPSGWYRRLQSTPVTGWYSICRSQWFWNTGWHHERAGQFPGALDRSSSDVGEVVFSVAGNAANNDTLQTGDFIYTKEVTSQPPTPQNGPPAPTASAIMLPFVIDTTQFRCNLIMSNLTGTEASVNAQLIDASGNVLASKGYVVAANGMTQINRVVSDILALPSPTEKQGYLILESSQKITAASTPVDNITTDSAVVQAARGAATRLLLPTSTSTGAIQNNHDYRE